MGFLASEDLSEGAADSTKSYRQQVPAIIGNNILRHLHLYLRSQRDHNKDKDSDGQWTKWENQATTFHQKNTFSYPVSLICLVGLKRLPG